MDKVTIQPESMPDEVLIERILSGEKRLFEHIMRTYNQRLYRIGMSVLADDVEVEDAMQTAYINAYEHLDKFEARALFSTWLTRIMLNECLARKKKKQKFKPQNEMQPGDHTNHATPAHALVNKELSAVLENAVSSLPDKYRMVFVLREIEDMSVKETSETLSIEESNVKARLSRAKSMLRENLSSYMKDNVYSFHLTRCDRIVANVFTHLGLK